MLKSIMFAIVGVIGLTMPVAAEDVRAAIDQTNARIVEAFKAGDAAAIAGIYTEDAKMLPPDATEVAGRDAIQQFWQSWLDDGLKNLTLEAIEVEADGDLAYEIGNFSIASPGRERCHGDRNRQLSGGLEARLRGRLATARRYLERRPGAVSREACPRRVRRRSRPTIEFAPPREDACEQRGDAGAHARALIPCQTGRKS